MNHRILRPHKAIPVADDYLGKVRWPLAIRCNIFVVKMRIAYEIDIHVDTGGHLFLYNPLDLNFPEA